MKKEDASFIFVVLLLLLLLLSLLMMLHHPWIVEGEKQSAINNLRMLQEVIPSTAPTFQKRDECENSLIFCFAGDTTRTCDSYVAVKPIRRCAKKQPGTEGKKLRFFCPGTCRDKCKNYAPTVEQRGPCENSDSFQFKDKPQRSCDSWVANRHGRRCKKIQPGTGRKKVKYSCPATCRKKCQNTNSSTRNSSNPSFSDAPTTSPTDSPTTSPTTSPVTQCPNGDATYLPGNLTKTLGGGLATSTLLVSSGLNGRVLTRTGQQVSLNEGTSQSAHTMHSYTDGAATVADDKNTSRYYMTANSESSYGGVGFLHFDSTKTPHDIIGYRRTAENTQTGNHNCGGGRTPWGTWLTSEESNSGAVYEIDPNDSTNTDYCRVPIVPTAGGRYESNAFWEFSPPESSPDNKYHFYTTEDSKLNYRLTRFIPDDDIETMQSKQRKLDRLCGALGDLSYLKLTCTSACDTSTPSGEYIWTNSRNTADVDDFAYPQAEGIRITIYILWPKPRDGCTLLILMVILGRHQQLSSQMIVQPSLRIKFLVLPVLTPPTPSCTLPWMVVGIKIFMLVVRTAMVIKNSLQSPKVTPPQKQLA